MKFSNTDGLNSSTTSPSCKPKPANQMMTTMIFSKKIRRKIPNRKNFKTSNLVSVNKLIPRVEEDSNPRRNLKRELNVPRYLGDYVTKVEDENDQALININYCYKATCNVPRTNREATNPPKTHHWKSKNQPTVTLSTCKAYYITFAKATQESLYLTQLLNELDPLQRYTPVKIFGNNQGAIALSRDPNPPTKL